MPSVDILLPTCNRLESLIFTLSGIAGQEFTCFRLIVADQSDTPANASPVVQALVRILQARCGTVDWHTRPPVHGIAEQRDFLLAQATADYVLYLDDDVWMEPWVLGALAEAIETENCGFVGAFPAGLSFAEDIRPQQQIVELWDGPVQPETVEPESPAWQRFQLHRAANIYHAGQTLPSGERHLYKVAWVAQCVLYDRRKLQEIGGFSFWNRLPRYHSGEEVLAQNLLMRRWGGAALLPSGTYSSEVASTVLNEEGTVEGHALDLLDEMVAKYVQQPLPMK
jgi:GT2 family glycosyltransferase